MKYTVYNKVRVALLGLLAVAGMATSCSNDDNFQPGEDVPEGVVGAFFDKGNTAEATLTGETEGSDSVVLKVNRVDTTEEATVPVTVVKCDTTAIHIPTSVHFDKGSAQDSLIIKIDEGLYTDRTYCYEVAIDDSQVSVYAAGLPSFAGTIFKGNPWKKLVEGAAFYFAAAAGCPLPTIYSDIYQYKNENRFYIDNFMGSGNKQEFSLTSGFNANDVMQSEGYFAWNADQVYQDHEAGQNGFDWIYDLDSESDDPYAWSIEGSDVGISSFAGYMGAWSWFSFKDKWLYFWAYCATDDGKTTEAYFYGDWREQ